jgi:hypothetical protein
MDSLTAWVTANVRWLKDQLRRGGHTRHDAEDLIQEAYLRVFEYCARGQAREPLDLQPQAYPILHWRWKVADTIPGGDARHKTTDDYVARIYVVFPHWFFPMTRTINYIWANQLPQGEAIPSSYTSRSMMLAVRSGRQHRGEWLEEQRDVLADYRRLFGEEPAKIGAIAIMTDTDNTGQSAQAWYDDIWFGPK